MTTAMMSAWKITRIDSAKPPSRRLRSLDTLIGHLMSRSAKVMVHRFDAPRPRMRADGRTPPIRDPEATFVIRWGGSAAVGRRRFSGSQRGAQRTRHRHCLAVANVIFGHAVGLTALRRGLLRVERSRAARHVMLAGQIGAIAARS